MMTMSRRGGLELDLNNAPAPAVMWDSVEDGLREAMLQHEIIFKNQVRELHRLYWTQKDLMSDVRWRRSVSVSAAKSRCGWAEVNEVGGVLMPRGILPEFRMSKHRDFDLEVPAMDFDSEPGREVTDELPEVKRPATDQRDAAGVGGAAGNRDDENTGRGLSCGNGRFIIDLEAPAEMDPVEGATAICSSDIKNLQDNGVTVNGLRVNGFSGFVLPRGSQDDSVCQLPEEHYHANHQRENWLKKNSVHTDFGERMIRRIIKSSTRFTVLFRECMFHSVDGFLSPSGVSVTGSFHSVNPNTQKCQPTTKYLHIDLNIAQGGPSAYVCPESLQKMPSPSPSSSVDIYGDQLRISSCKYANNAEPSSKYQTQPNSVLPDIELNGSEKWMHSGAKDGLKFIRQNSELSSTVRETTWCFEKSALNTEVDRSVTGSPVEFSRNSMEGISSMSNGGTMNSRNGSAISFIQLHKHKDEKVVPLLCQQQVSVHIVSRSEVSNVTSSNDIEENCLHPSTENANLTPSTEGVPGRKPTSHEKNEEDTVSSRAISSCEQQGDQNEKSDDCSKLDRLSGSIESTSKNSSIEELRITSDPDNYGLEVEVLRPKRLCNNGGLVSEISGVCLDDSSFDICASYPGESDQQKTQVPEIDLMIFKAAGTLVSMSLQNPACPFNFNCERPVEFESDEVKSRPQFSLDSFEEMTLGLEEVQDDGNSVTAKQLDNGSGKESCGIKLRRGRGLRDFQKDILPGLVSLSRHEICEDIHTIKHELRKISSHSTSEECFLSPVRTRRSRIYNACRMA